MRLKIDCAKKLYRTPDTQIYTFQDFAFALPILKVDALLRLAIVSSAVVKTTPTSRLHRSTYVVVFSAVKRLLGLARTQGFPDLQQMIYQLIRTYDPDLWHVILKAFEQVRSLEISK